MPDDARPGRGVPLELRSTTNTPRGALKLGGGGAATRGTLWIERCELVALPPPEPAVPVSPSKTRGGKPR